MPIVVSSNKQIYIFGRNENVHGMNIQVRVLLINLCLSL